MKDVFISAAKRSPLGSFLGTLSQLTAPALAAQVVQAVCKNTSPQEVLMGCVLQAGVGQSPARQAALSAGLSNKTPCSTINKVCGSGMKAIMLAYDQIKSGSLECILAGGMESMSLAPYLMDRARTGYRFGHGQIFDHMMIDGLEDAYGKDEKGQRVAMGLLAEKVAEHYGFSREMQETYTHETYLNALMAVENNLWAEEIVPITLKDAKGNALTVTHDEGIQKVNPEKFKHLKPAFKKDGTITAATASSISDGAAAVVLTTDDKDALAKIVGHASFGREPEWFSLAPIGAIEVLLRKIGWTLDQVDLFEINEAFAVVPMAAMRTLDIPRAKINVNGGACVLGHPLGASGARVVVTLVNALRKRNLKRGIATVCIGSGEATAIAVEVA